MNKTFIAATLALGFISLCATEALANAVNGDGTMTVSPTSVCATSTGNSFTFQFRAPNNKDFLAGSQATVLVPAGWTAPQISSSSSAGFVSVTNKGVTSASSVSVSGSTITITFTA